MSDKIVSYLLGAFLSMLGIYMSIFFGQLYSESLFFYCTFIITNSYFIHLLIEEFRASTNSERGVTRNKNI